MSNKSRGKKKMQPTGLPPNFTPQMPMKMRPQEMPPNQTDPKTQQAMQMMGRMASQMREQMEAESLVKPHSQEILTESIMWHWELPNARQVKAVLDKNTKEYLVYFDGEWIPTDSSGAAIIGAAISSAARWETLWKQYAGEYLIGNPYEDDSYLDRMHPNPAPKRFEQ